MYFIQFYFCLEEVTSPDTPLLGQRLVHTVEDDVDPLRFAGSEDRRSPRVQRVSAAEQGDVGEIHRTQLT